MVASVTIDCPQTEAHIDDIPVGEAILRATAYPEAGAQGVPQATAETTITIVIGETRLYALTLETTIRHVEITPNPASVIEGESIQLTATAKDGDGNIVLVPATSGFTWAVTEGANYIALDAAGVVSGRAEGQATVSAVENESGVAGAATVIVRKKHDLTYFCMAAFSPEFPRSVVVKAHYVISTDTWGEFSLVYEDPTYRCGSVHGGVIDNSIFLFFDRRDTSAAFHDIGYIRSFDLDGSHWSEFVPVDTGLRRVFAAHGHFIHLQGTDTYFQPYYGWDLIDDTWIHSIKLFRSDDRGQHWTDGPTVHEGRVKFVEPSGVCVGDNGILLLVRREDQLGSIWRFVSSDGGETWSGPEDIGREGGICVLDIAADGVQSVLLSYLDRGKMELELAYADANTAFADPYAYSYGTSTPSANPGYPSVCPIGPSTFYVVYSEKEDTDERDCDIVGGIVTVPLDTDPFADFRKLIDTPYKEAYGVLLDTGD